MTNEIALRPWQYSVKLDVNAKGWVQPSVHVYSDDERDIWLKAMRLLDQTIDELKGAGYKVATDIKDKEEATT